MQSGKNPCALISLTLTHFCTPVSAFGDVLFIENGARIGSDNKFD